MMTKHLNNCLRYLVDNWSNKEFTKDDVYPHIARAEYNLNRLEDEGLLTSRIEVVYKPFVSTKKYYSIK